MNECLFFPACVHISATSVLLPQDSSPSSRLSLSILHAVPRSLYFSPIKATRGFGQLLLQSFTRHPHPVFTLQHPSPTTTLHHHPISNLSSTAGNPTVSRNLPATERLISQLIYRSPEPRAMPRPSSGALYAGYVKLFSFQ